jgi:hypothetical protein
MPPWQALQRQSLPAEEAASSAQKGEKAMGKEKSRREGGDGSQGLDQPE